MMSRFTRNLDLRHISLVLVTLAIFSLIWSVQVSAQSEDDQLALGGQIYAENCAVCHGIDGEGRLGATLAKDWPSIRPDLVTKDVIANGVPGSAMPAWSLANGGPLTDEEIDAVVYYILSWQTAGVPEFPPSITVTPRPAISPVPGITGDPNQGGALYDLNCKVCHGENGEGRIGATLAKAWPSIRPDLTIKTTIENGIEGTPMLAWSQTNGGPLNEKEIDDLVAFVMTFPSTETPEEVTPEPEETSPLSGWTGVIVTVVLFIILVAAILFFQRQSTDRSKS